ncbi:MAG: hypothetical protein AB7G25_06635 [Sphingomonadaceae bacterium]
MIWGTLTLIVGAMLLVRIGWAGRRPLAFAGWALAGVGLILLTWREGAWGLALGTVTGSAAALVALLHAAWTSPAVVRRPPRDAPTVILPRQWHDFGRRFAVFLLVVPIGFAAAQWLAFTGQMVARRAGAGETDTIVLTFFLQPVLWMVIMSIQMTRTGPIAMLAAPAVAAVAGTILWSLA